MVEIAWEDFERVDVRVGRVVEAEPFPEAKKLWTMVDPWFYRDRKRGSPR